MKPATPLQGRVESVRVGDDSTSLITRSAKKIQLLRDYGVKGDLHAGTRLLDSREDELLAFGLPKGMEIANHRQISIISHEELLLIEQALGLPNPLPLGYLGENIVLSGIPKLTQLPPGTMVFFRKNERTLRTAVIVVWKENGPCLAPGEAIQTLYPHVPSLVSHFPKAAHGRRGIVGTVYTSGFIEEGDTALVVVPRQRTYIPE